MSGAIPWSVKGIDPRAREAVREAARREGLTIGEWLSQAILANEAVLERDRFGESAVSGGAGAPDGAPEDRLNAGLDTARGREAAQSASRERRLSEALARLAERIEVDDRRNALSLAGLDRTVSAVNARIERNEAEVRDQGGRMADLLDQLHEGQSVLLEQMRKIEQEDLPAVRAEANSSARAEGRLDAVEGDLHLLSARAIAAEAATGEALAKLDTALTALDAKVSQAITDEHANAQAAALRESFEAGLDTMAHDVASMIAETRADIAGQIASALGGLQPEEMTEALGDMSRRLAAAERRHTQTIEAVSIEIKRLSESMDRRLRVVEARNDDAAGAELREEIASMSRAVELRLSEMEGREAEAFSRMGDEVGRIAERLDVRVANSEARSAAAIEQVGEQISGVVQRLSERQDKFAADVAQKLTQNEERQSGRLSQALAAISEKLGAIETNATAKLSPMAQAMDSFAARLKAIESHTGAAITLPELEPALAPAYLEHPIPDPAPHPTRKYGLEHERDLHARHSAPTTPEEAPSPSREPLPPSAPTEPREAVYLEDIEEEFARREEDHDAPVAYELASERPQAKAIDDPFADIESSPPEDDEEELFWSTDKPDPYASSSRAAPAGEHEFDLPNQTSHAHAFSPALLEESDADTPIGARAGGRARLSPFEDADFDEPAAKAVYRFGDAAPPSAHAYGALGRTPHDEREFALSPEEERLLAGMGATGDEDLDAEFADDSLSDPRTGADEDDALARAMFGVDDERGALGASPMKDDYLAAARRAAQANVAPKGRAKSAPKPAEGLRGLSRVMLWGAAGALAAALAGGVYAYKAETRPHAGTPPRPDAGLAHAPKGSIAEGAALAAAGPNARRSLDEAQPPGVDAPHAGPLDGPSASASAPPSSAPPSSAPQANTVHAISPLAALVPSLESAAAHNDPVAQYQLSLTKLASGDTAGGAALLQRAADQGLAMAQYRLAKLYERGEGVGIDLSQARIWTERAAVAGNRKAMHDLGVYYARGEGAPFDEGVAFKWFRQAGEYGVADSQFNLGVLYSQGRGVAADPSEAYYWFSIAALSGDSDARARASMLEQQLGASVAANIKARVRAFKPKPAIPRANGEFGPLPWAPAASVHAAAEGPPRT